MGDQDQVPLLAANADHRPPAGRGDKARRGAPPPNRFPVHLLTLSATGLLIAALAWAFVGSADEMFGGETGDLDRTILLALRSSGNLADLLGPPWLEITARDLTALGGYPVLTVVTISVVGYLLILRRWDAVALVVSAVGGGMVLSQQLKSLFGRPRPDLVPHVVDVATLSFPSGHAMLSAATYLTLGALLSSIVADNARERIYLMAVAILLTLLIGTSRVYLGVHWPSDVLAGWFAGAAWATVCGAVAAWLQRRH